MLIVAGTFDVAPEDRDAFLAARAATVERSRAEPGCLAYVMSLDPSDAGRVHLFERWETKDALRAHLAALQQAGPVAQEVTVLARQVTQYEISAEGPIGS